MLGIPNQPSVRMTYESIFAVYHPELGYARSELRYIDDPNRQTYHPFLFLWSTCMPFFIVIRKLREEWLTRRFLYPNGHLSDCSGSLTVHFVRMVLDGT